jgi:aminoglycoside phosphotransferase (APT) family kinase protein
MQVLRSTDWRPDHPVNAALAARLVASQFPELSDCSPEPVGRGWDCDVWRFGDFVFRFPRRRRAVELLSVEAEALPRLAASLPVRIPVPQFFGRPSADFPAPFLGYRYLTGSSADALRLSVSQREALARPIARFLRRLHAIGEPAALALGIPDDTFRGDLALRAQRTAAELPALEATRWASRRPELLDRVNHLPPPAPGPVVAIHGDLYARHLLLDQAGNLSAVIDWGDLSFGDRAIDLSIAYSFLPKASHAAFWSEYGPADEVTRARARHVALCRYGILLTAYAMDVGDEDLLREADFVIENSLG